MKYFFMFIFLTLNCAHSLNGMDPYQAYAQFKEKDPEKNQRHLTVLYKRKINRSRRRAKRYGVAKVPLTQEEAIASYPWRNAIADYTVATAWLATLSYHAITFEEPSYLLFCVLCTASYVRGLWEEK